MLDLENKEHKPLRVLVYEELKMQILTGKIAPGARLMEIETSEELGVSRTPVREAIKKLEKEGLVVVVPRKGSYAAKISKEDLTEILEVRENLEGMAAQYAAERMPEQDRKKLQGISQKYAKAAGEGRLAQMIKYDTLFHRVLVEGSENKTLISLIEQLEELMLRFRYIYYDNSKRGEKLVAEHDRIAKAVTTGDCDKADKATRDHIRGLKEIVAADSFDVD